MFLWFCFPQGTSPVYLSTIPNIQTFAHYGWPRWYLVLRPNRLSSISASPESLICGRLRCKSSLKGSRMKEAQSTPDFWWKIPACLLASSSVTPSKYCLINNMISCVMKCARSKKGIFSNWTEFHAPLLYSNASRHDQYFWIFYFYIFLSVQVDEHAGHCICSEISPSFISHWINSSAGRSITLKNKMDFKMTLLKYLLFQARELPVCNCHLSILVDRASWQYLWYGQ